MIKKILEGIRVMAEAFDYLSDSEKEQLARRPEYELLETLDAVSSLARLLNTADNAGDRIRRGDPYLIKNMGNNARRVIEQLKELGVESTTSPIPAPETSELPVQEPVASEAPATEPEAVTEPTPEPVVEVVEQELEVPAAETSVAEEEVVAEPEVESLSAIAVVFESTGQISEQGSTWLIKALGEDWAQVLGVASDASSQTIVSAIFRHMPPRRDKEQLLKLGTTRLTAHLEGLSSEQIAQLSEGDKANVVYQYLYSIAVRLRKLFADQSDFVELPPADLHIVEDIPELTEPETRVDVAEIEAELQTTPQEPLTFLELAALISEKLDLNGAETAALRSFLDLRAKGEMTKPKIAAIEKIQKIIRRKIDQSQYDLSLEEKEWLRRAFGVQLLEQGITKDTTPISMYQFATTHTGVQKNEIPNHVYVALEKLFSEPVVSETQVDALINSVFDFETLPDATFREERKKLFADLDGTMTHAQAEALSKRAQYGDDDGHMATSQDLKDAMKVLQHLTIETGGVNSGNQLVDEQFRKFISPVLMTSNLDALRTGLPEEYRDDPRAIERIVAAGIYSIYKQIRERAA